MENTDARMTRLDAEFRALEDARATMEYLGYTPKTDTWRAHCARLGRELDRTMTKHCR